MKRQLSILTLAASALMLSAAPIKAPAGGKPISNHLIGIFFEDISSSADGGLSAELIQNGSFEFSPVERDGWGPGTAWKMSRPGHSLGNIIVKQQNPIHPNNPNYMRLEAERTREFKDYKGWRGFGLQNDGFDGISLKEGEKYDFSVFLRNAGKSPMNVRVALVEPQGWGKDPELLADAVIDVVSSDWKKYECSLTPSKTTTKGALTLLLLDNGALDVDMVSLKPADTYNGHGLRKDLVESLAALNPKFMRFPGGCIVHGGGDGFWNTYRWKETVGPKETRKQQKNCWGYHQSFDLGYHEYFQLCEDLGMEPLPILPSGVNCQGSNGGWGMWPDQAQDACDMADMDMWTQEALDLIEWANGDVNTKWGKIRAEGGHPEPFNLKYLGIGNEDLISEAFETRFKMIRDAVNAKYPEIIVVGTVGPFFEGSDYEEGWDFAKKENVAIVDEHYYVAPGWYINHRDYYDNYDKKGPKVYLGEYASHYPGRESNLECALSIGLYLTDVERNADVVTMTSYAPLLSKKGRTQWRPDLIYFDNKSISLSPDYYVQQMYGVNPGTTYVPSTIAMEEKCCGKCGKLPKTIDNDDVTNRFGVSTVIDEKTGDTIVRIANMLPVGIEVDLAGYPKGNAEFTTLTGSPRDTNVKPISSTIEFNGSVEVAPYSFSTVRIFKSSQP